VRIFERARETKIIKIQRIVKKFLAREPIIRTGLNKKLLSPFQSRIAIRIYE